jgi:hypothetical protein
MSLKELYEREKYIVLHGQSTRFRIKKWIVIFLLTAALSLWKGLFFASAILGSLLFLGVIAHFVLRWKTKAWTESWGPFTRIRVSGESKIL